jgi:hypothetical protein
LTFEFIFLSCYSKQMKPTITGYSCERAPIGSNVIGGEYHYESSVPGEYQDICVTAPTLPAQVGCALPGIGGHPVDTARLGVEGFYGGGDDWRRRYRMDRMDRWYPRYSGGYGYQRPIIIERRVDMSKWLVPAGLAAIIAVLLLRR